VKHPGKNGIPWNRWPTLLQMALVGADMSSCSHVWGRQLLMGSSVRSKRTSK
jgi:hypothetical protein